MRLHWQTGTTPHELHAALRQIGEEHAVYEGIGDGIALRFERTDAAEGSTVLADQTALIRYRQRNTALRAVGGLLAGLVPDGTERLADAPFATIGFMLDCSRNAVMQVGHFKCWLRRLALLGYNMTMLYTEDTYEIPGEEYFGYQRGRYAGEELRELDRYAANLGIELIPCIQTLGHIEQILRWPHYADVRDQESVLLAGDEKTYRFVTRMLDVVKRDFRSSRIHLGMDEAWHLGRGAYLDRHGFRRRFDIFNEHLERVVALCRERGLQPMIWSDMYFVMGSPTGRYLDPKCNIPPDVAAAIPKDVQLVYWDYYHADKEFYLDWIKRHRELGCEPVMASGVWTWSQLWYNRELTETNAGAAIDAAREARVQEIFFTLWGDDGAYCDFDSALAGLAYVAERAFGPGDLTGNRETPLRGVSLFPDRVPGVDVAVLERRFRAVCGASYEVVLRGSDLTGPIPFAGILWDDPLLGIFRHHGLAGTAMTWSALERRFAALHDELVPLAGHASTLNKEGSAGAGDVGHAVLLAEVLSQKIALRSRLEEAYHSRDNGALVRVRADIPALCGSIEALAESWRRQWLRRNKPFGLEVLQIRLAGQIARHHELARRLDELIADESDGIPELDVTPPRPATGIGAGYHDLASGSVIL